ncbi:anoctamin-4 isoform X8, partial [Biomphalaria glabrata]
MDDGYEGVPLSPEAVGPIGFEMQIMDEGVTPSNDPMETEAPLPPPPPPLPPIGFESHVPVPPPVVTPVRISGSFNKGFQNEQTNIP